jgi:hypothetical protein
LARWAARFRDGTFNIGGLCEVPFTLSIGPLLVRFETHNFRIKGGFLGGRQSRLTHLELQADGIRCVNGALGSRLRIEPNRIVWDGGEICSLESIRLHEVMTECLGIMNDLWLSIDGRAGETWRMKGPGGFHLDIREDAFVSIRAATAGDPARMRLSSPLEIRCEDISVRLAGGQLSTLSRLAKVRLTGATVQPDGSVQLEGGSRRGLNRALKGGLNHVSRGITDIVRGSPRLREFLAHAG